MCGCDAREASISLLNTIVDLGPGLTAIRCFEQEWLIGRRVANCPTGRPRDETHAGNAVLDRGRIGCPMLSTIASTVACIPLIWPGPALIHIKDIDTAREREDAARSDV